MRLILSSTQFIPCVRRVVQLMSHSDKLQRYCRKLLKKCLNLAADEDLTIVSHESLTEISATLWRIARRMSGHTVILTYRSKRPLDAALPERIVPCLIDSDACVVLTPVALNENIFDRPRQNGTRVVIFQNPSPNVFMRCLANDLARVANVSRKLADLFSIGQSVSVSSPTGTNLIIKIPKTKGLAQTSLAHAPGDLAEIPGGKASIILNKNVDGKLVLDRVAGDRHNLAAPIALHVREGQITQIKGSKDAGDFRKALRRLGQRGRLLNAFSVGANDKATFGNSLQEDQNVAGSVHFTLGHDLFLPEQSKTVRAILGMVLAPTVTIDGRTIVQGGHIKV